MGARIQVAILTIPLLIAVVHAEEDTSRTTILVQGEPAPDFEIPATMQQTVDGRKRERLSDYREKSVLVVFFPKAFSIGCTRQLTEYRNEYDVFREADTEIIAISGDSQAENDRFHEKYNLPFPVIGDPDHAVIEPWGVPSKAYLGMLYAQRCVFLVDPEGIIQYVEMNYSVIRSKKALYETIAEFAEAEPSPSDRTQGAEH